MRIGPFASSILMLLGSAAGFSGHAAPIPPQQDSGTVRASLPGKSWAFVVDLPGFTMDTNELKADGRLYIKGSNRATGVVFSVFLEDAHQQAAAQECARSLQNRPAQKIQGERGKQNIRFSELGPMNLLEEEILFDFQGRQVSQSNVYACLPKEDVYIDIHLSKMELHTGEEKLFTSILQSVRFEDKPAPAPVTGTTAPSRAPSPEQQDKQPAQVASPGSASVKLDDLKLSPDDLPGDCTSIDGVFPVDIQTRILYPQPRGAIPFLPPVIQKAAQSFDCGGEKGTLYFFEFSDAKTRQDAEDDMIRPTLWGEDMKPTPMHPEQVVHFQNFVIIISFRRDPVSLDRALLAKISNLQARDTQSGILKDIGDEVLGFYSLRLKCGTTQASPGGQAACAWLDSFAQGDSPGPLLGTPNLFVGVAVFFDPASNPGRTYYESLLFLDGKTDRVGFGAVRPDNDDEKRDIEALIQAKRSKSEVPKNGAYQYIMKTTPGRECKISRTPGKSLLFFADNGVVPVYLRKKGDALYILIVPVGGSAEAQSQGPFLVGELH